MKKLFYNGTIITMEPESPQVEAVLVENKTIVDMGSFSDLETQLGDGEKIDLKGKTLLPGFIDSHSHFVSVALQSLVVDLTPDNGITSITNMQEALRSFLNTDNLDEEEWLIGMNYDERFLKENRHPTKEDLDYVSKDKAIVCVHVSAHMCVANSKALELYGYYTGCSEVPGGIIHRVPGTDEPNGILEETAFQSVAFTKTGFPKPEKMVRAILESEKLYASQGYTTVSEISCMTPYVDLLKWMAENKQHFLDVIIHCLNLNDIARVPYSMQYMNHFRVNGAKIVLDGSPQMETAWLTKPYYKTFDGLSEDYCGYPCVDDDALYQWISHCVKENWPICLHCNGDAAADQYLNIYERVWKENGQKKDLRPLMIHCQTVRDDQLERMKTLGMNATFFIGHVYYWGDLHYETTLGPERAERISPIKSAIKKGVNYTIHQDSPITPPNQLLSIHIAVNREAQSGRLLGAEQCLTVDEALMAATINAAYQYGEEHLKGSIKPGKLADFVILDKNPLSIDKKFLKDISVLETIKEGTSVYSLN